MAKASHKLNAAAHQGGEGIDVAWPWAGQVSQHTDGMWMYKKKLVLLEEIVSR